MAINQHTIQVFEQATLNVGKNYDDIVFTNQHFQKLALFQQRLGHNKYFQLQHKSIRFSSYVGVIRVGNLTIEILPKIDQYQEVEKNKTQKILLDLLRYCKILHLETVPNNLVQLRQHSLLDVYISFFVQEAERVLHYGLFRSYSRYPTNAPVLKGQLMMSKQIRNNVMDKTKFYCNQVVFDFNHPFNRILKTALEQSQHLCRNLFLKKKINYLLKNIPFEVEDFQSKRDFDLARKDRNTHKYESLLSSAQVILEQFSGSFYTGEAPVAGLFFDMNFFYEKFIYTSFNRLESQNIVVKGQSSTVFWGKRKIRPDIVFSFKGKRYIIDTKWKILKNTNPSMQDLKQMFIYCQYFDAEKGILLYPNHKEDFTSVNEPFHTYPKQFETYHCQVLGIHLIKEGKLNYNIGREILQLVQS